MILLTHPLHGQKHAYSDLEVKEDAKHGWIVSEPAAVTAVIEPATTEQDAQPTAAGCAKCGKVIGRGLTMHVRFCKGA